MRIKFLLVGCGNIGRRHAALAADHGLLEAVCDIDEKKTKSFTNQIKPSKINIHPSLRPNNERGRQNLLRETPRPVLASA